MTKTQRRRKTWYKLTDWPKRPTAGLKEFPEIAGNGEQDVVKETGVPEIEAWGLPDQRTDFPAVHVENTRPEVPLCDLEPRTRQSRPPGLQETRAERTSGRPKSWAAAWKPGAGAAPHCAGKDVPHPASYSTPLPSKLERKRSFQAGGRHLEAGLPQREGVSHRRSLAARTQRGREP